MNTSAKKRKIKSLGFYLRFFTLFIFVLSIVVAVVFSTKYIENNNKLSIEFAGGYETQVQYDGRESSSDVVKKLAGRVDPLGTSNVNIENITSNVGTRYNLALSKDAGVGISAFVHNVARNGYFYLLDKDGNDLLATKKDQDKWSARDKRLKASDVFKSVEAENNPQTHRPQLKFNVKNSEIITAMTSDKDNQYYIYSDIGQLLDYIRSSIDGIIALGKIVDEKVKDDSVKKSLLTLLENNTPGLGKNGSDVVALAQAQNPILTNLLNVERNGQFGINWTYADVLNAPHKLSVDTNDEKNVYDPANRFVPSKLPNASPMNAWLPYIKDLVLLPEVSAILQQNVVDYRYVPYWVGNVTISGGNIIINDDTFNSEKTEQFQNILSWGLNSNNFTLISYNTINPTLGASSLKVVISVLVVAVVILMIIVLFYYRLLGAIVLIVMALFLLFTLVGFTFINGIWGPETVIAFIIGLALLLDTIINLLERFKSEHLEGKTLVSAFKSTNKKTLAATLDTSVIILMVSLTVFWFGTRAIKGFIIMTSIATFGVILFGILLMRLLLWMVVRNNWLENKPQLLGTATKLAFKKQQSTSETKNAAVSKNKFLAKLDISKWNFWHKATKWILVAGGVIVLTSGITFGIVGANVGAGFDKHNDFIGMAYINGDPANPDYDIQKIADEVIEVLKLAIMKSQYRSSFKDINSAFIAGGITDVRPQFKIIVSMSPKIAALQQDQLKTFLKEVTDNDDTINEQCNVQWNEVEAVVGRSGAQLLINMIIAIALSFIIILIYIFIRFQLTYVLPLIAAIIFAVITTLALISICQIQISTSIIGILLGVMVLTIISTMAIFDHIRETKISNEKLEVIANKEINDIANKTVQKVLPRTLFINIMVLLVSVITTAIVPSFWIITLSLFIGCVMSLISAYFIAPWLWTYCERWRIKRYRKCLTKIKKHFSGADEYIIKGINE